MDLSNTSNDGDSSPPPPKSDSWGSYDLTQPLLELDEFISKGWRMMEYPYYAMAYVKRHRELQNIKKYRYLITFTIDPKKGSQPAKALEWIKRNVINPLHKPLEVYYAEEQHKNGQPHWHVVGVYAKSLKKNLFKYYEKMFGNIDFSKTIKGEGVEMGLGYISKENNPIKLI